MTPEELKTFYRANHSAEDEKRRKAAAPLFAEDLKAKDRRIAELEAQLASAKAARATRKAARATRKAATK